MKRYCLVAALFALLVAPALAWEYTGHVLIGEAGARSFPSSLPGFLRTPESIAEIGELSDELDLDKYAGYPHDADRDPAHYVDIGDDGTIAGIPLTNLPRNREDYDTALRRSDTDQYKVGFLPYSLVDGWQQVAKDFSYWRADVLGETKGPTPQDRAYFAAERRRRERLTVRDLGVWSHFVGDASQPLHTTSHFDGWDKYPNSKGIHHLFEGPFVHEHVTLAAVLADVGPYQPCHCTIQQYVAGYLAASNAFTTRVYELGNATDSFRAPTPEAIDFTTARIAAGASALRDLVVDAWTASADGTVGYPPVKVHDIESGLVVPTPRTIKSGD